MGEQAGRPLWPHLREERQDGDACMAANHWHIHLANIQAQLCSVEGLGTNLEDANTRSARCERGEQN
jgi:hypothetical protein